MVGLMAISQRAYAKGNGPSKTAAASAPVPMLSPGDPRLHGRPSNTSRWFWFCILWGHCSFPLGLDAYDILFVPSKTGVSVSLSPSEGLKSNPAGPQGQISWWFPVLWSDPQAGKPDIGFRTFTTVQEPLWYYLAGMKFDLIVIAPLLPSHWSFFFVFGCGVSFLVCSSVLLSMVVQQLVAILLLLQEMSVCASTPPSWIGRHSLLYGPTLTSIHHY